MDLRLGIRRRDRSGVGTHVIRFRGLLLAAEGDLTVYLTPRRTLVFYQDRSAGTDGHYWLFDSLGDAAGATDRAGAPRFSPRLLDAVAERLALPAHRLGIG